MKYLIFMIVGLLIFSMSLFLYKKQRIYIRISDGKDFIETIYPIEFHGRILLSGKVFLLDIHRKNPSGFIFNSGSEKGN